MEKEVTSLRSEREQNISEKKQAEIKLKTTSDNLAVQELVCLSQSWKHCTNSNTVQCY